MNRLAEVSADAKTLQDRIKANEGYGKNDLNALATALLDLRPGESVLDIGCGTGKFLCDFARQVGPDGAVMGLDVDDKALSAARSRGVKEGFEFELACAHMDNIGAELDKRTFDAAVCCYALYYATDASATIEAVARSLVEDGRFLIVGPHVGNNREFLELIGRSGGKAEPAIRQDFMDGIVAPTCERLFKGIERSPFENAITYPNAAAVVDYWKSTAYFDPEAEASLTRNLEAHFAEHAEFVIKKRALALLAHGRR